MNPSEIFEKIRIEFLFENPFLSVLALSMPTKYVEDPEREVLFETDGKSVTINTLRLEGAVQDEVKYQYAHTLLHIIFKHAFRCGTRDKRMWNIASDIVINNIMKDMKNIGKIPASELYEEDYVGKIVEEVYDIIFKEESSGEGDTYEDYNGDLMSSDFLEVHEEDELDAVLVQALSVARRESRLPSSFFSEVSEVEKIDIGIDEILKEFLNQSFFEKEQTYSRPDRRYIHTGLYMPGHTRPKEQINIILALDSSSSVSLEEYSLFLSVIFDICESFHEKSIKILPFDTDVREELISDIDESNFEKEFLKIPKTNGGTNFNAVVDYIDHNLSSLGVEKNLLLVLSDGAFEIERNLNMETIFALTQKKFIKKFERYGRAIWLKI